MKMKTEDILKEVKELELYHEIRNLILPLDLTNEQFEILSEEKNWKVKWGITERPDLPKDLMYKLAADDDDLIRDAISKRLDLPEDLMYKLAEDKEERIRYKLAGNPKLTDVLMYKMAEDYNTRVRWTIAEHPDLPKGLIIRLSCDYWNITSNESFKKLNNLKSEDLENAYDLIRTSKLIRRINFEKTFNYIISTLPELSEAAKLFKSIILKGKRDMK
jgi:hypothetical protein